MNGEKILVSYGLISEINENNGINHKCATDNGSSGYPILSLKNNKLIGVHFGSSAKFDYNQGTLIIYAIMGFNKKEIKANKINNEKINEITIIYNIEQENKIKLFGKQFIENNKNNCKIIIDNKEQEIVEFLAINENMKKKESLEIKLKEIKPITNMSYMFGWDNWPHELISLPDISKWDTNKVNNMSYMFYNCKLLLTLPDISTWNTKNVTNMNSMFKKCISLSSLPDISKWDTRNVTGMRCMFNGNKYLLSLPNISKWDVSKVTDMGFMFSDCNKLSSLSDISKWDTKNVTHMESIFYKCYKLSSLPDISKWKTEYVTNMSFLFSDCNKLLSLPDISK